MTEKKPSKPKEMNKDETKGKEELKLLVENALTLEDVKFIMNLINNSKIQEDLYNKVNHIIKLDQKLQKIGQYLTEKEHEKNGY